MTLSAETLNQRSPYQLTQINNLTFRFVTDQQIVYTVGFYKDTFFMDEGAFHFFIDNSENQHGFSTGQYKKICQVTSSNYITCIDADGDTFYIGTPDGIFRYENGELAQILLPGQTTGIQVNSSTVQEFKSSTVYDLQGRKLSNGQLSNGQMRKGVYIVNGKRVVKK